MSRVIMELKGFYRAKVITNEDKQFLGRVGVYVEKLMAPEAELNNKYIWVKPANIVENDRGDVAKHSLIASNYNVPRKNAKIAVFFLGNDFDQGFYLPGVGLPYEGQLGTLKNTPLSLLKNLTNYKKKPNIFAKRIL